MKIGLFVCALASAGLVSAGEPKPKELYCEGSSWMTVGVAGELRVSALMQIAADGRAAIEIRMVGDGQATPVDPWSAMELRWSLNLRRAAVGEPALKAIISLDRYSGELTVFPESNGKVLFSGKCKPAIPLI